MAQFPSSIISFPIRVNGQVIDAGDINSPDNEITAIQSFVGIESSTFGMTYDLRSPNSNGGGHVQTANKGGTGQTAYTKGDLLVASSASVLTKQAVGTDGYALTADSTTATGVSYAAVATAKVLQDQSNTYAIASVISASVYGITFPNIVSVLTQGQGFVVRFPTANASSAIALQVSSLLAQRIKLPSLANPDVGAITASLIGIVENDGTNFQIVTKLATDTSPSFYKISTATYVASDAVAVSSSAGYVKVKELQLSNGFLAGISSTLSTALVKTTFDYQLNGASGAMNARIYRNASAVGIEAVKTDTGYNTQVETLAFGPGDTVELWAKTSGNPANVRNFRILGENTPLNPSATATIN